MTRTSLRSLAAAVLATAAAGLTVLATSEPASAATCSTASGVSVVVDFKQLGGGIQGTCVSGGGQKAASLFPAAGFQLTYVQNQPGFVCRVSGLPAKDAEPCVDTPPATAYWGLWWSDGKTGTWTYSSYGVNALKIPDGGYVALAWKQGDSPAAPPGAAAATHPSETPTPTQSPAQSPSSSPTKSPSPSPTRSPSASPTRSPSSSPTSTAPSASGSADVTESGSATESANATDAASPTQSTSPSASATPSASDLSSPPVVQEPTSPVDTDAAADDEGGVPTGLAVVLILALFACAAGAVVLRRRQAP